MNLHRLRMFGLAFAFLGIALPLFAQTAPAQDPAKALSDHLSALKNTQTLEAHFVCEKKLALLETPLLSQGQVWIKKGDPREGDGGVRFSTEKPYVSELILAGGKVLARSQHETKWTTTHQSGRPGLTAVMAQLAGWSTGDPGKLTDQYTITAAAGPVPAVPSEASTTQPAAIQSDSFTLTPTNKDLAKAIKTITVAVDKTTHHVLFIEILTQQDDATRYWFTTVKDNAKLPATIFTPSEIPADSSPSGEKP